MGRGIRDMGYSFIQAQKLHDEEGKEHKVTAEMMTSS